MRQIKFRGKNTQSLTERLEVANAIDKIKKLEE